VNLIKRSSLSVRDSEEKGGDSYGVTLSGKGKRKKKRKGGRGGGGGYHEDKTFTHTMAKAD